MKIINQHTQFSGMSLQQATEEKEGIPVWMECCIYRKDRILPIVIKEYFDEVKSEHPGWKELPRRMLKHRAIQQCARLAFNIGLLHIDQSENSGQKINRQIIRQKLFCRSAEEVSIKYKS
jgi:hypothetical protein